MKTEKKIVFDGQVYAQSTAGAYRYCNEILKELDKMIDYGEYTLLLPSNATNVPCFKNIKVVHLGKHIRGFAWGQVLLPLYCMIMGYVPISFYNITPLLKPGIVVVYDIGYKVLSKTYRNLYGKASSLWHRLNYWIIAKSKLPIITISNFCKNQICEVYKVNENRVTIIGCGWEHYNKIKEDNSVLLDLGIIPNSYYLGLSSLEERKNFKWIVEVAKKNPEDKFIIVGKKTNNVKNIAQETNLSNVLFTGYLDDSKSKALMKNAKALLFPSTFEGFGIPPIEALSVRTHVICSDKTSLPEVCGKAVTYIDPFDYEIELDNIMCEIDDEEIEKVLEKYSWTKSAVLLNNFIKKKQGIERDDKD